jgi:hypothetical protein
LLASWRPHKLCAGGDRYLKRKGFSANGPTMAWRRFPGRHKRGQTAQTGTAGRFLPMPQGLRCRKPPSWKPVERSSCVVQPSSPAVGSSETVAPHYAPSPAAPDSSAEDRCVPLAQSVLRFASAEVSRMTCRPPLLRAGPQCSAISRPRTSRLQLLGLPERSVYQITFNANWICREAVIVEVIKPAPGTGTPLPSKIALFSVGGLRLA